MTTKIFLEQVAQIGYLFANCDGKFDRKEQETIFAFIQKIKEHGIKDEDVAELASKDYSHITLSEVVQTVKKAIEDFNPQDKKKYIDGLTEFIEELITIDGVITPEEQELLDRWKEAIA